MKIRVLLFNNFSVFLQNSQNVSASRFESMYWIQNSLILLLLIMMNLSCKLLMQVLYIYIHTHMCKYIHIYKHVHTIICKSSAFSIKMNSETVDEQEIIDLAIY